MVRVLVRALPLLVVVGGGVQCRANVVSQCLPQHAGANLLSHSRSPVSVQLALFVVVVVNLATFRPTEMNNLLMCRSNVTLCRSATNSNARLTLALYSTSNNCIN